MLRVLLLTKEDLVGNAELKGSLGCSGQEMVEFKTPMAVGRVHSMNFRRAEFDLFRDPLVKYMG